MKKLLARWCAPLLVLLFVTAMFVGALMAAPTLILGSLSPVTNATSTTTPILAFAYNQTMQQFSVSHGIITNTNQFHIDIFVGVQGASTNGRTKIGVWWPSFTNATTETFSGSSYAATNWMSVDAVATNAGATIGVQYGQ